MEITAAVEKLLSERFATINKNPSVRLTRLPQPISNCLSTFSSHFTCPQGSHYRLWCWLLVTPLLTQGSAKIKNLTRQAPRRLCYWIVLCRAAV
jgi:hypothetical protein